MPQSSTDLVRTLKSALFWRILLSSLLVVAVLGIGLYRANAAHDELDKQFERLVQHDLKLADDAEQLLRVMVDLETGKRGFLLTDDRSFLAPYEQARTELEALLPEAQRVAENGMEDERVAAFGRLVNEWIQNYCEPQIRERQRGVIADAHVAEEGKALTDEMRGILADLRKHALAEADEREQEAFDSAAASQRATRTVLLLAIIIALGSGAWIARDIAGTTAQLEEALAATGRLEPTLPPFPSRRDELGAVAQSLFEDERPLAGERRGRPPARRSRVEKSGGRPAHESERKPRPPRRPRRTRAQGLRRVRARAEDARRRGPRRWRLAVARRDEPRAGRRRLSARRRGPPCPRSGGFGRRASDAPPRGRSRRAAAQRDGEARALFSDSRGPERLAEPLPALDLGVGAAPLRWALAYPVAIGSEGAGAMVLAGVHPMSEDDVDSIRDAARQLAVALHNAWTHDRLREKSVALAEQGERLARANRVKTEFLASMSHELRTPLSAILGFADLLTTSPKEQLSPRARESLERIKRNGEHLLGLINDVLDLAKAEAGRVDIRPAPVHLAQLARACVAEVESLRVGKDLKLFADAGDAGLVILTDAQRVRQILLNLLSNAIKFTDRGEVVLSVQAGPNEVHLAVRDTGIGIPASGVKELFQEFHQLEAGDGRRYEGTGVGLALSRRLARALGGDIEVRSRQGEGSTFTLVLPRLAAPTSDASPPSAPPSSLTEAVS